VEDDKYQHKADQIKEWQQAAGSWLEMISIDPSGHELIMTN
jgi:hypothetical protein